MSRRTAVDLHLHSKYSDGEDSIRDLVLLAKATAEQKFDGLSRLVISIADHDTLAGQREALEWGKKFDVETIPSSELTTTHERQNPHILFYFSASRLDEVEDNKELGMIFKKNRDIRKEKDRRILSGLRAKGFNLTYNELELVRPKNSVGGTPYIVMVLLKKYHDLEKRHIDDVFALVKEIEKSTRKDSSLQYLNLVSTTKILREAKVVPCLAHPLLNNLRSVRGLAYSFFMLGGGLGAEYYYP
ncbi:MAG: hypothetical protein AABY07_09835, partial [Nanoarchaeota archaeon]